MIAKIRVFGKVIGEKLPLGLGVAWTYFSTSVADQGEIEYVVNEGKISRVVQSGRHYAYSPFSSIHALSTRTQKTTVTLGETSEDTAAQNVSGAMQSRRAQTLCTANNSEEVNGKFRIQYSFDAATIIEKPQWLNNLREEFDLDDVAFSNTAYIDPFETMLNSMANDILCNFTRTKSAEEISKPTAAGEAETELKTKLEKEMVEKQYPIVFNGISAIAYNLSDSARQDLEPLFEANRRQQLLEAERKNDTAELENVQRIASRARAIYDTVVTSTDGFNGVSPAHALGSICLEMVRENPSYGHPGACVTGTEIKLGK